MIRSTKWIEVDYENDYSPLRASAAASSDGNAHRHVEETIEFFGLNTVLELVLDRNTQVTAAIYALRKWLEGDAAKGDDVRSLSNRYTAKWVGGKAGSHGARSQF